MNAFEVVGSYVLKGAEKAGSQIQGLSDRASKSSKVIDNASKRIDMLGKSVSSVGGKMSKWVTGPLAAAAVGVTALANKGAKAAKEIENYSKLTGESAEDFQAQAFAADTVGIELDKYGDILKDVQDRVGDFMSTGAGPMADFFENIGPKVGVTAEQFKNLSGKDALQLYVSSLERAGVSSQQMTFYMEALAGDASKLTPLFAQNGKALKDLGDIARESGLVMSAELLESSKEGRQSMKILGAAFDALTNKIGLQLIPIFESLVPVVINVVIPAIETLGSTLGVIVDIFSAMPGPIQAIVGGAATLVAALGPVLFVVGKLISAFATFRPFLFILKAGFGLLAVVTAPIAGIIALVAAAITGLYLAVTNWGAITEFAQGVWKEFSNFMTETIGGLGGRILDSLKAFPGQIMNFFTRIGSNLSQWASSIVSNIVGKFKSMFSQITGIRSAAEGQAASMPGGSSGGGLSMTSASGPGGVGPASSGGGTTNIDMRNSVFRDDKDMLDRIRRRGQGLTGGFA